jgi:hypothetical protein
VSKANSVALSAAEPALLRRGSNRIRHGSLKELILIRRSEGSWHCIPAICVQSLIARMPCRKQLRRFFRYNLSCASPADGKDNGFEHGANMNPKVKLLTLGIALALPIVAWFIYFSSHVSSGTVNNPPDSAVFSLLVYVVLSTALVFYAAKKVGIYRPPVPHPVPGGRVYFQAVGIRLVLVWVGGFFYTLYEGYTGAVSPGGTILGASLFLAVIAGTCWLLLRDWSATACDLEPQSHANLSPARTDSIISILLYSGLLLFVVYEALDSHLLLLSAFFLGALLLGFIVIHSWSIFRINSAGQQQLAPYPPTELIQNLGHSEPVQDSGSIHNPQPVQDARPPQIPEQRQLIWTPFGGPIPVSSKHDHILVGVLIVLMLILRYLASK